MPGSDNNEDAGMQGLQREAAGLRKRWAFPDRFGAGQPTAQTLTVQTLQLRLPNYTALTLRTIHAALAVNTKEKKARDLAPPRDWKRAYKEDAVMRPLLSSVLCLLLWMVSPAGAQDPVAERAVAAAKEYVKAKGLKDPKLTILLSSLYNNSFPDFAKKWEELTGVKFEIVPLGYTDIPAKIMQEAVSKTGVYDIFNDFPYTMPDAAGAKVIIPLDD